MSTMKRLLLCVAALMVITAPALAHVEVSPEEAARGSVTTFTFTVPNEEAPAKTTKVEIFFPEGAKFTEVNPQPVTGWTQTKQPTSVTWEGGPIAGEDEVDFQLELGPLPNGDALTFKVLQTYDNGEVVRWIDAPPPGGGEADHPAPVVRLTGPAALVPTTSTRVAQSPPTTAAPKAAADDDSQVGIGVVVLVLVAVAVVAAGAGFALQRRRRAT
jgi:uncharacterized protein YcnI